MVSERSHRRTKRRREDDGEHIDEEQEFTERNSDASEDGQRSQQAAGTVSHSQSAHVEDSQRAVPGSNIRDRGSSGYVRFLTTKLCSRFDCSPGL